MDREFVLKKNQHKMPQIPFSKQEQEPRKKI